MNDTSSTPNGRTDTLAALVRSYLADQCGVLLEAGEALQTGENVVHPTRVAVRRTRSTLRVFPELFDVPQAAQLEEDLAWWAGVLGPVRDLDVLAARLADRLAALPADVVLGPVSRTVTEELAARRNAAMAEVADALQSERYARLMTTLVRWQTDPPLTAAAETSAAKVTRYAKRASKKASRRVAQAVAARSAGEPGHDLFHRARKAAKRHRYAVELAQPVWGDKATKAIEKRKDLQDVLGDHRDGVLAAEFLRGLGARLGVRSGQNGFTYGLLYAQELAEDAELLGRVRALG